MKIDEIRNRSKFAVYVVAMFCIAGDFGRAQSVSPTPPSGSTSASWQSAGQSLGDNRQQPAETVINATNVQGLKVKWTFTTGGDVSATPTVANGVVYAPDWKGNLFAIDANTGRQVWSHQVSEYDGQTGSMSRVSPLVLADEVIVGDNVINRTALHNGANVIAVDPSSGIRKWITQVDPHPGSVITGSPTAYNGIVYVPVASNEEALAAVPGYPCCTFRGSLVALDARTGSILWKTYTVPDNGGTTDGYSGGAIWQQPAIDVARGSIYVGTGDNYTVPDAIEQCETEHLSDGDTSSCTPPNDHLDSVMAFDLTTGKIKWANKITNYDTANADCELALAPGATPCPTPPGRDFDFPGAGPNLLGNIVGFGQKSGVYWAVDPDTGAVRWSTLVGPGSFLGGIMWGTASDGNNIYVPIANFTQASYSLSPSGQAITWGSWAALNAQTGQIVWQTADPTKGGIDMGAASVANGVVYAGSFSGAMYALNAASGKILWSFASGGSVVGSPSIVNGVVYWGSGYTALNPTANGIGNNKIYAFSLGN
ncbi:Pyrrolo-quinoline quinone repeat-containing protein [Granulicella mallensis MP5ACTX8]|uniref:Pyrrolo-quinoline quinone repeat-containing protein n=2 Tax=Granulicella mallensis TaxID=940614 RepID=G8P0H1_GRAMM|nr:Pyrrolo-quinoline quinone repeat-containing protein [Granulicella mallensis MP5ACTX8]